MTTSIPVELRIPTESQKRFINSRKKRKVIRAGRRAGKTTGIGIDSVEKFLDGRRILYAAPTNEQVETYWHEVTYALRHLVEAKIVIKNETKHIIEFGPNYTARIRAKTAWNAETLRGDYADDLILDEWQLMNEDAWEVVGAPMLADNNGNATFIYTPPSLRSIGVSKAHDKMHAAKLYKRALADTTGRWEAFHFTSFENPHISRQALDELAFDMTALVMRQEIGAEDLEIIPGALWTPEIIERNRIDRRTFKLDSVSRIVVAIDPIGSSLGHECGIVVAGSSGNTRQERMGYLLADYSMHGMPNAWAKRALSACEQWKADCIVVERNYGGDMVAETIRLVAQTEHYNVPRIIEVSATRGKVVRAEPISGLTEQGVIKYVGNFPTLEDQCCSFVAGGANDRVDAKVWAFTYLLADALPRMLPLDEELMREFDRHLRTPDRELSNTEFAGIYGKTF